MRHARLILNPISWARRKWSILPEVLNRLEEAEIHVDLTFTKPNETMTPSVERSVGENYDMIIVGGGDGTVSEVAAGLVGTGIPLGILPVGHFNNIARGLGLPVDTFEAGSTIARGCSKEVDVCVANGSYFFEAAGVGLDASLFPIRAEIKRGHYGKVLEGARIFLRHRQSDFTLILDGQEMKVRSSMVVVANGPYYGTGFTVAPQADPADGLLDVVTFECGKFGVARYFALSARNRVIEESCVSRYRAKEVTILTRPPLPAHADGKPLAGTPVTCRVIPGALRVIVPVDSMEVAPAAKGTKHT